MSSGGIPRAGRTLPRGLAFLFPIVALLFPAVAEATPQGTAGLTIGAAGAGEQHRLWDKTLFHLGVRGDVLFGRDKPYDFAVGPYAEIGTLTFREVQFGGGVSGLLPVVDFLPIVLSIGAYGRKSKEVSGVEPGVTAQLFWGTRSFNFHGNYVMTAGLISQLRYGLGPSKETSIVIGAQLDFLAMSLPALFVINAIRGGSHDTDPVKPER